MVLPSHAALSVIKGTVYWYDQYSNLRTLAWADVTATSDDGLTTVAKSVEEGTYIMWVAPGRYNVSVSMEPGFFPQSYVVYVPDGGVVHQDFYLEQTGEPIPEFASSLQPLMLVVAVLALVVVMRRRERTAH